LFYIPFIQMFPIGLGLKVLFGSAILTVLSFWLLLPTFGHFTKGLWSFLFFNASQWLFCESTLRTVMNQEGKIDSLFVSLQCWPIKLVGYDVNLDSWTKNIWVKTKPAKDLNQTHCSANTILVSLMLAAPKELKTHCRILKRQYCWKQKVFEN
jgi:hypothetical protein